MRTIEEGPPGATIRANTVGNYLAIAGPTVLDWQGRQERGMGVGLICDPCLARNRNKTTSGAYRGGSRRHHSKQRGPGRHRQLSMTALGRWRNLGRFGHRNNFLGSMCRPAPQLLYKCTRGKSRPIPPLDGARPNGVRNTTPQMRTQVPVPPREAPDTCVSHPFLRGSCCTIPI